VTKGIHILNASSLEQQHLIGIATAVREIFRLPVRSDPDALDLRPAFDASRGQHHSTALLAQLLEGSRPDEKCIAVVDVDLFIPVLTFVFGEAQFDGQVSIVSIHRLANEFYGMPADDAELRQRLEKEIVHELGHTFGLYHCHQFECVMRSSTYVEEIDLKRAEPCPSCRAILAQRNATDSTITSHIGAPS
jgi:archaemetzincin